MYVVLYTVTEVRRHEVDDIELNVLDEYVGVELEEGEELEDVL